MSLSFPSGSTYYPYLPSHTGSLCSVLTNRRSNRYGRLNITGTVLSKRKIQTLVASNIVRDWDDPRLYTLIALRRRGIPPGAIRAFIADLGVSDATTTIQLIRLESIVRKYLERTLPRLFLIPDPIRIVLDNLPDDYHESITLDFLKGGDAATFGTHTVPFAKSVFIDRSDFRTGADGGDDPSFFRLAPGKTVGLLNVPHPVLARTFTTSPTDPSLVTEIHATYLDPTLPGISALTPAPPKPKAFIQWVADAPAHNSPIRAEVRIFKPLFKSENPDAAVGGFLTDVNTVSEEVFPHAVMEVGFEDIRRRAPWPKDFLANGAKHRGCWDVRFQGVRVAYFAVDRESILDPSEALAPEEKERQRRIVLNQIVPLKEDVGKA